MLATGLMMFPLVRSKSTSRAQITAASTHSQKSIAVLPLLNENGDPDDEYFSDGLSEELIAALAQVKGLKVIGRSSSFRFKDKKEDSKTIGEKLGVSTLLEGTVRKQGDHVRIVAELVNATDGSELWSRTFDREVKDIFAVQAQIAEAVATSLEPTVLGAEKRSVKSAATKSVEAHNAYLQGHFYFERRNLEDYRKAVGFFDQAIRFDPDYALAYAEQFVYKKNPPCNRVPVAHGNLRRSRAACEAVFANRSGSRSPPAHQASCARSHQSVHPQTASGAGRF